MLTNEGISFTNTEDGEAVVEAFTDAPERTFDCVLMDMRIPIRYVGTFVRLISALPLYQNVPCFYAARVRL